jgi:hypothetical protein
LAEDALRVHLLILFLLDFKDKLEVLLREAICKLLGCSSSFSSLATTVVSSLAATVFSSTCQLGGDFLLHHATAISVIGVLQIEFLGGQETM